MYWKCLLNFLLVFVTVELDYNIVDCCEYYKWNPLLERSQVHFALLILARGGSKGIKLKNISKVGGISLIRNTLKKINLFKQNVDSIWVSTDNLKILSEASKENANVHWRSTYSATDRATSLDGVNDFFDFHPEVNVLGLIQCTSPFIQSKYIKKAIELMKSGNECVFSATRSYKLLWVELNDELVPVNFNPNKRPRRQDWNGNLVENGMFYFSTSNLIKKGTFQSKK